MRSKVGRAAIIEIQLLERIFQLKFIAFSFQEFRFENFRPIVNLSNEHIPIEVSKSSYPKVLGSAVALV